MISKDKFEFNPKKINNHSNSNSRKTLEDESSSNSCLTEPDFVVICGFFQKFGTTLQIVPNFRQLQEWLENTTEVSADLHNLLLQLFQRGGKLLRRRNFEEGLLEFCGSYSKQDAKLLKRRGFAALDIAQKLRFLKELLESLLVTNADLSHYIENHTGGDLRDQPLGRDRNGRNYLMRHNALGTWSIYARDCGLTFFKPVAIRVEELISQLGGNEYASMLSDSGIDEDSNSSSASLLTESEQQLIVFLSALSATGFLK